MGVDVHIVKFEKSLFDSLCKKSDRWCEATDEVEDSSEELAYYRNYYDVRKLLQEVTRKRKDQIFIELTQTHLREAISQIAFDGKFLDTDEMTEFRECLWMIYNTTDFDKFVIAFTWH